jgi:hypothetical protein
MVIRQGIVGKWVQHFDFLGKYRLRPYDNPEEPVVVFGVYDLKFLSEHRSGVVLNWTGNDCRIQDRRGNLPLLKKCLHTTSLPAVWSYLNAKGIGCRLMKFPVWDNGKPMKKGDKVYAYLNKHKPKYHGSDIVNTLPNVLVGDFSIPSDLWRAGYADKIYGQCYIGLFLSDFAGGAGGALEMGLRGMRVVTNVIEMPHVIHWKSASDVRMAVEKEKKNIGYTDKLLAERVRNCMVQPQGFDLEWLSIS